MAEITLSTQRFKRIPRPFASSTLDVDPLLNGNLEQWPHLKELVQCFKADWLKDEVKYGHYESVALPTFEHQTFEGPDTDVETEQRLANLRQFRTGETTSDEETSTSGRDIYDGDSDNYRRKAPKHIGVSPLHAYDPVFNWETERNTVFGQRMPELPSVLSPSTLKVAVKVKGIRLQAGPLAEPIYGTVSLYHRDKREKLSEDFYFQFLPSEFQEEGVPVEKRVVFSLDSPSASICFLLQLEKHATEDGGVTSSVYSRKEPVHLVERERQKLQVWARIMPYREPFAWTFIPLFDPTSTIIGGFNSPSSPLPAPGSAFSGLVDSAMDLDSRSMSGSKHPSMYSSAIVEVSAMNRVKECYTEESIQDPKRKVHKHVKGTITLEVERLQNDDHDVETVSSNGSLDREDRFLDSSSLRQTRNGSGRKGVHNGKHRGGSDRVDPETSHLSPAIKGVGVDSDFSALEFRVLTKNEPLTQLLHCLFVYPLSVHLSKKRNLFIRVELRKDDADLKKAALDAFYPRTASGSGMQRSAHSQIAVNTRTAQYHDEFKIRLPALLTPHHHLLFTFFHVDLQMKLEAPKPVVVGYSVLPLSMGAQVLRSDGSLPISKDLLPHYLQESVKEKLDYLEDARAIFKLRLRLCSSLYPINEKIRDFFSEYDRHVLRTSPPWGSELLEAINSLKGVDPTAMLQFLQPAMNMLLRMIADGGETLQVAAFRAMVNILTRVQQESTDGAERNRYLVQYIDFSFDDFDGLQAPVYPGLCSVWRSLARSKAKGYRVGPVYDDVLSMAWVFLEVIVKSMALEQSRAFVDHQLSGEDIPPLQLKEDVFKCIWQLYDCLLTEVHERCKKGLNLARRLNSSLAFFCYDLLSVIDPRQVFELVALYFDKFTGICQPVLHECKLIFLRIICDHDLFVEMPGRDPSERNYLASVLMQELFLTWDHEDLNQRAKAARILVMLMAKHEYDVRYQKLEDKLYIAQLYFPLIGLILDEMPVFYNLSTSAKRDVLLCVLQIIRNLDDGSLMKAWQQSVARTRLFFKLMEECLVLFEHRRAGIDISITGPILQNQSQEAEGGNSPRFSEILSPAIHAYFSEAARLESRWMQPQSTPESGVSWKKMSPQMVSSPSQPYSLREALAQAQSARRGPSNRPLRESLHPRHRQKLELWEENLSTSVSLQVLEVAQKFTDAASSQSISTDFEKLDCVTALFTGFLSRNQPLVFWKAFIPVFHNLLSRHGAILMGRENDRFLKQLAFHLLRLAVFRNESIRRRAVVGLQILVRNSFLFFTDTVRLRVMLTITLSELMADVQVTQMKSDGSLEESGEARRLRKSLQEMAKKDISQEVLKECGLSENTLETGSDGVLDNRWRWSEVVELSETLEKALEAAVEHALLGPMMAIDKYGTAESYHSLAWAYAHVPDLHIMWLLHLCDAHQEMQSWAEAAQCAVAVAGVIMQALVGRKDAVWGKEHVEDLRKICPMISDQITSEAAAAEVEGYGASKLTVDSAVKYLQLANKLFVQAELFHFCAGILELIIPVHKSRHAYAQLSKCHISLTSIYESILEQESSPIPFIDATYYRLGFYGERFGKLNRKEYVYREARDVRLGDIMEKLGHIYESRLDSDLTLHIIPDSRQVNAEDLQPGVCYLQITSVDPVTENEDLESRRERPSGQVTGHVSARVFDRFLFDTPFTKNGRTQGGLEDQWKRRTVVQTEGSFPALVNRLLVTKSESREFSPIENAIGMIETRTAALVSELDEPRSTEGDQLPRLQSLQRILQGSVAVQVNSGVLGVCTAFLSDEPSLRLRSQELQQLIQALLEFMGVCKRAIRVHARMIGEEDQDFHSQLVNGFQSLTAELSHYIPAILSEL